MNPEHTTLDSVIPNHSLYKFNQSSLDVHPSDVSTASSITSSTTSSTASHDESEQHDEQQAFKPFASFKASEPYNIHVDPSFFKPIEALKSYSQPKHNLRYDSSLKFLKLFESKETSSNNLLKPCMSTVEQVVNFFKLPASYFISEHLSMFKIVTKHTYEELEQFSKMHEYRKLDTDVLDALINNTFETTFDKADERVMNKVDAINKFKDKHHYITYKEIKDDLHEHLNTNMGTYYQPNKCRLQANELLDVFVNSSTMYNIYTSTGDIKYMLNIYPAEKLLQTGVCTYQTLLHIHDLYKMFKYCYKSDVSKEDFISIYETYRDNKSYRYNSFEPADNNMYVMSILYNEFVNDYVYYGLKR